MAERLLIVDDDPDALALIELMLRRRGYEIQTAPGGVEALDSLGKELPDLILLDLMMPFMDGYQVLARLKADPRTVSLPVVVLTAKSQVSSHLEALHLGADDYVVKPVHPDELVTCIRNLLERVAQSRASQAAVGNLIGCVGCKGGVGATLVAVNVALALAERGRVVLVDWAGDALAYLGEAPFNQPATLSQLAVERIDRRAIERAWVACSDSLHVLYDAELMADQARAAAVFDCLSGLADYVIVDLGAWAFTASVSLQWIIERCQALALMVAPGQVEIKRAQMILRQLGDWHVSAPVYTVWVIRGQADSPTEAAALGASLGREVVYTIPYSTEPLLLAQPGAPAADSLRRLAHALAGDT